jgi:hypothetical protein
VGEVDWGQDQPRKRSRRRSWRTTPGRGASRRLVSRAASAASSGCRRSRSPGAPAYPSIPCATGSRESARPKGPPRRCCASSITLPRWRFRLWTGLDLDAGLSSPALRTRVRKRGDSATTGWRAPPPSGRRPAPPSAATCRRGKPRYLSVSAGPCHHPEPCQIVVNVTLASRPSRFWRRQDHATATMEILG